MSFVSQEWFPHRAFNIAMTDDTDWDLLARYVSGEATADERADIERRAASDPSARDLVAGLERRWQAASVQADVDVDAAWKRLAARLPGASGTPGGVPHHVVPRPVRRWSAARAVALPLAAAVLLMAGAGWYWRVRAWRNDASLGIAVGAGEQRTGIGERRALRLADGTQVVLAAASVLRIDSTFGNGVRDVHLEGEALFRVTHDASHPFVVHAAGTLAEDLGTEFVVRAYPGDGTVRVAVQQGSVALRRERNAADTVAVLGPRDVARIEPTGPAVVLHDQDPADWTSWTTGTLVFDDVPLSDVAGELQRWYDIECQFADSSVAAIRYHGTHPQGERLDDILQAVGLSADVRIERSGRVVRFSRGRASSSATPVPRALTRSEAGA